MIELRDVSKDYGNSQEKKVTSLSHITLSLPERGLVFITGPSGCGKTTLLNLLDGLDRPTSGSILYEGKDTATFSAREWDQWRNEKIAIVFQEYNLINHLSVLDNVLVPTSFGKKARGRKEKALSLLEKVGLLALKDKFPTQLSGGERQRVAIARSLMGGAKVLLADEPTGALDYASSLDVMALLNDLKKDHLVLVVSHNLDLAKTYAEWEVSLFDGKLVEVKKNVELPLVNEDAQLTKKPFQIPFSLAFKRIKARKTRSLLLSLASSIGIIGMALVLSLRAGVNNITYSIEQESLLGLGVPLSVYSYYIGFVSPTEYNESKAYPSDHTILADSRATSIKAVHTNYIDDDYLSYVKSQLAYPEELTIKYAATATILSENGSGYIDAYSAESRDSIMDYINSFVGSASTYHELPDNKDQLLKYYDVIEGHYPSTANEALLMVDCYNSVSTDVLADLGFPKSNVPLSEVLGKEYQFIPNDDYYLPNKENVSVTGHFLKDNATLAANKENPQKLYQYLTAAAQAYAIGDSVSLSESQAKAEGLFKDEEETRVLQSYGALSDQTVLKNYFADPTKGQHFKISGILRPSRNNRLVSLGTGLYYPSSLWAKVEESNLQSQIAEEAKSHLVYNRSSSSITLPDIYEILGNVNRTSSGSVENQILQLSDALEKRKALGSDKAYSALEFYPNSYEEKNRLVACFDAYNKNKPVDQQVRYTDLLGIVTTIMDNYVGVVEKTLLVFSSLSLVVSSLMMGLLTENSVKERSKEIGIYRSLGASRGQVSLLFVSESFFLGILSGLFGVGLAYAFLPLVNHIFDNAHLGTDMSHFAFLTPLTALAVALLAILVNLLGAFLPAEKAGHEDPALALRGE